jgi:hypothetical protein
MHSELDDLLDEITTGETPPHEALDGVKPPAAVAPPQPEPEIDELLEPELVSQPTPIEDVLPANGYDVTFRAPMDFSLAFAVAEEDVRTRLLQDQQDPNLHADQDWMTVITEPAPIESPAPETPLSEPAKAQSNPAPFAVKPIKRSLPRVTLPQVSRKALLIGGSVVVFLAIAGGTVHWIKNRPTPVAVPVAKSTPAKVVPATIKPAAPAVATSSPTPVATKVEPTAAPAPIVQPPPTPAVVAPPQVVKAAPAQPKPAVQAAPPVKVKPVPRPVTKTKPVEKAPHADKKGWQDKANSQMDAYLNSLKKN